MSMAQISSNSSPQAKKDESISYESEEDFDDQLLEPTVQKLRTER
jgi:hypothetical protein